MNKELDDFLLNGVGLPLRTDGRQIIDNSGGVVAICETEELADFFVLLSGIGSIDNTLPPGIADEIKTILRDN